MGDTIAALATSAGVSAIGIVRLSGDAAPIIADSVFRTKSGMKMLDAENQKLYYGELLDEAGETLDLCLCTVSRAPNSYTGENTAEFFCHGSPVVLSGLLRLLFSRGARQAEAGEFTKRAFLNGKLDLSQAEAVVDLIDAETKAAAKNAASQLGGVFREKIEGIYSQLLEIMAHFYAVIDYPDEDIEDFELKGYAEAFDSISKELKRLYASYDKGQILKEGIPTAIAGRPNVGKSSLLNALLGYDRAIVTGIAGTTRDTIEEKAVIGTLLLRLTDTAGIRKTNDEIERLGVERSVKALTGARLTLCVFDGSQPMLDEDRSVLKALNPDSAAIAVINKSDLPQSLDSEELFRLGLPVCRVSALTGDGLEALEKEIAAVFSTADDGAAGEIITNARQADAAGRAAAHTESAGIAVREGFTPDAALTDIEAALSALGEITGKTMRDDIISKIFERFCVGK